MKKLIPLSLMCLLLLGVGTTQAQTAEQPVGFKVLFGNQSYDGDLGNEVLEFSHSDFVYGVGMSAYLSPLFDLSLDLQFMRLDKFNGPDDTVTGKRNTEFQTDNFNVNLMLRLKPFTSRLNPYLAAGIGGNLLKDGSDVREEDSHFAFAIPFGIGVNYELKDNVMLNVQYIYNRTFSDEIDNYPLESADLSSGRSASEYDRNIDDKDHDDFTTFTIGAVYTFGGEEKEDDLEERLLRQSLKNLEAAENSSAEASATLKQAQQLNDETLTALEELRNAIDQMPEESEDLKAEMVRIVNNIQFEFDKSTIIDPAMDELNSLANIMQQYQGLGIDIAAHADERGSESYNEKLSMRRAQAVKDYLVNRGLSASRITTSALGESSPLMSGNSATAYAQNRAVQLTLSYNGSN